MAAAHGGARRGARGLLGRLLGRPAGRPRGWAPLAPEDRARVRADLDRLLEQVGRDVVPDRCAIASWGDPCTDPPGARIRTYCRVESVTDPTAPCTSWLYVCPAHRGRAALLVAVNGRCALHGARVDVIGVEVL